MGERSPHNDADARGCFIGLRPDVKREDMTLAIMEGVAFALRDCVEVARANGLKITGSKICGGGAKSFAWQQIIANVLGVPVSVLSVEEGPAYGAAILAMVGAKEYLTVENATNLLVKVSKTVEPKEEIKEKYEKKYQNFRSMYPALKGVFQTIKG
jgi:xylulokinase